MAIQRKWQGTQDEGAIKGIIQRRIQRKWQGTQDEGAIKDGQSEKMAA